MSPILPQTYHKHLVLSTLDQGTYTSLAPCACLLVCSDLPLSKQAPLPFSRLHTLAAQKEARQRSASAGTVQHFLPSKPTPETNQIDCAIERRAIAAGPPQEMPSFFWSGRALFMVCDWHLPFLVYSKANVHSSWFSSCIVHIWQQHNTNRVILDVVISLTRFTLMPSFHFILIICWFGLLPGFNSYFIFCLALICFHPFDWHFHSNPAHYLHPLAIRATGTLAFQPLPVCSYTATLYMTWPEQNS